MRFEFDGPEYPGAFVEFSSRWTRREVREFWRTDLDEAEQFALIVSKVTACDLGGVTALTVDTIDDLDVLLFRFIVDASVLAVAELARLGEAVGRRLRASYVATLATPTTDAPADSPTS